MKSIIEDIYYGNTGICDIKSINSENTTKLFDEIQQKFTSENLLLINNLVDSVMESIALEEFEVYKLGFKTGFALAMELTDKEDL